jgi:hypothetical protein
MIQHEFIAIDEGHAALLHINERDQAKTGLCPSAGHSHAICNSSAATGF